MGAWGIKTFENDDSSDWLYDLEESEGLSAIEDALNIEDEYVEAPEGASILAAGEIYLALKGQPRDDLPEGARDWVKANKNLDPSALKPMLIGAIELVRSDKSELQELWQETEDFAEWSADVTDLLAKVKAS